MNNHLKKIKIKSNATSNTPDKNINLNFQQKVQKS